MMMMRRRKRKKMRRRMRKILILLLLLSSGGCGADPLMNQARTAAVVLGFLTTGESVVRSARGAALDRVEAQYPHDPEHDEQLDLEAARWVPAGAALDSARSALLMWIDAIDLARIAGGGGDAITPVLSLMSNTIQLLAHALDVASSLGVQGVPIIPAPILSLAGAR
jgi:hypothetical protein